MCAEHWGGPVSVGRLGLRSGSLAGCLDGFSEATAVPRLRPTFLWSEAPWFFLLAHSGLSKESLTASIAPPHAHPAAQ